VPKPRALSGKAFRMEVARFSRREVNPSSRALVLEKIPSTPWERMGLIPSGVRFTRLRSQLSSESSPS
jgi:hypothetical protein